MLPPPRKRSRGAARRRRVLAYMDALPCAAQYETSYAHRAVVTHAVVAAKAGFLCTASEDGHVKFWKKMQRGVEFVKHFHAHVGPITDVAASFDGLWLATTGDDGAAKLYDVHAFDMACILRTKRDAAEPYVPGAACWPKPNVWSAFNQSIDGMLHGPPPPILSLRALRSPHLSLYESLSPSVSPSHRSEYIADHRTVHGTTCGA